MRRTSALAVAFLLATAAFAAPARAADNACVYDAAAKSVTYSFPGDGSAIPYLRRGGTGGEGILMGIDGSEAGDACEEAGTNVEATVGNTDRILLAGNPATGIGGATRLKIGLAGGPFAPGATPEPGGSEIEIEVPEVTGAFVVQIGGPTASEASAAGDHIVAGSKGLELNADEATEDLDVIVGSDALSGAVVYGGEGDDELSVSGDAVAGSPVLALSSLYGGEGEDALSMTGSLAASGLLAGGPGDDSLEGNGGRGSGGTTVDYSEAPGPVSVDLSQGGPQAIGGGEGTDTLSGVHNVFGGSGPDSLTGDAGSNIIYGNASGEVAGGGDEIHGGGQADLLNGSGSDDELFGEGGEDILVARAGADAVHGGDGADTLSGDGLSGASASDRLYGEAGDDTIQLDRGDDELSGGEGRDELEPTGATGGLDVDLESTTTSNPGLGTDSISEFEDVSGTFGFADELRGDDGPNVLDGNGGADVIDGRGGSDQVLDGFSTEGATLSGGPGPDLIVGGSGDDTLSAPEDGAFDMVECGEGNDDVTSFDAGLDALVSCAPEEAGTPPADSGGSIAPPPFVPAQVAPITAPHRRLHCRKGFRKVKRKGRRRCVRAKVHRRHGKHHRRRKGNRHGARRPRR